MKSNSLGTKLLMAVICLTVLAYFGLQGYRYYSDPLTTTVAYRYEEEKSTTVTGWVIRQEQVLPEVSSGLLRLSRSEGEKVEKGGTIAVVYADEASMQRQSEMDALQTQMDQLTYARESAVSSEAGLKLDNQIMSRIFSFRGCVTAGRLDAAAEDYMAELRSLVLKRDYTYAGGEDLNAQLTELSTRLAALRAQSASQARAVTAPVSGVYSAVTDGYESVLTPESLEGLTPSAITRIQPTGESSQLGKLITSEVWYYAASVNAGEADRLSVGKTVTLRFVKGSGREMKVTVKSVGQEENGRVVAVFSSNQYLSELTLLRQQSADIVMGTVTGIRVPSNALRTEKTVLDKETGEMTTRQQTGLYCIVGLNARFKPVEVLYTDDDGYALVRAEDGADDSTTLRPGDEIIVTAKDLYDGKVIG